VTYQNVGFALQADKQQTTMNPDGSISVYVPITFKRAGGRKFIMTPTDPVQRFEEPKERDSLVNAIIRAFRWKEQIDNRIYTSMRHLADKEKISESYACRVFRLTLLAPDIIEAILSGRQPKTLTLAACLQPLPIEWEAQRRHLGFKIATV